MAWDPLAPKRLAAAIALGGLSYMMVESAPNWGSIGVGLSTTVAFILLSLLPDAWMRITRAGGHAVDSVEAPRPQRRRRRAVPDDEPPHRPLNSQPVVFKLMRERRRRRGWDRED